MDPVQETLERYQEVAEDFIYGGFDEGVLSEVNERLLRAKKPLMERFSLVEENGFRMTLPVEDFEVSSLGEEHPNLFRFLRTFLSKDESLTVTGMVRAKTGEEKVGRFLAKRLDRVLDSGALSLDFIVDVARELSATKAVDAITESRGNLDRAGIREILVKYLLPRIGELFLKRGEIRGPEVMLSANLSDFVGCSTNLPFTTCLKIGGEYFSAVSSFAMDSHTLVAYFLKDGSKIGRVFYFFPEDPRGFVQSRVYGTFPSVAQRELRKWMEERLLPGSTWRVVSAHESSIRLEVNYNDFQGYFDPEARADACKIIYCKHDPPEYLLLSLKDPVCLGCGRSCRSSGICGDCVRRVISCHDCDGDIEADDAIYIGMYDYYVCPTCAGDYAECEDCGELYHTNDLSYVKIEDERMRICDNCLESYVRCDECGSYWAERKVVFLEDVAICELCARELLTVCEYCGEYTPNDDAESIIVNTNGREELWCPSCTENHAFSCKECGKLLISQATDDPDDLLCQECWEKSEMEAAE